MVDAQESFEEGVWGVHVQTAVFSMNNQQGLYSTGHLAQCYVAT